MEEGELGAEELGAMVVLVTGASSGIGETVARTLVKKGHRVILMARRAERLKAIEQELNGEHPECAWASAGDVARSEDCERAVKAGLERFGSLDGLVNCAGAWVEDALADVSYADIADFVNTDVLGAANITRAVLPVLRRQGFGRLLHVNGLQGHIRQKGPVLYTLVESAVRGLCESLREEVAGNGVHVSLLTLGAVANQEHEVPAPELLFRDGKRYRLSRGEVAETILFILTLPPGVNIDEIIMTPLIK